MQVAGRLQVKDQFAEVDSLRAICEEDPLFLDKEISEYHPADLNRKIQQTKVRLFRDGGDVLVVGHCCRCFKKLHCRRHSQDVPESTKEDLENLDIPHADMT